MKEKIDQPAEIDAYIAQFPEDVQQKLESIRAVIKETVPDAAERIGYGMPGFYLNGPLVWYAAHKRHIGFYPKPSGLVAFEEELSAYEGTKGSVHFPLDQPIPFDLIRKIVRYRVQENMKKKKR